MVTLPDHLHAVCALRVDDCDYATCWALIKAGLSPRLAKDERRNKSRMAKGERGVWQRPHWDQLIRDERDYARDVDDVHYSPVKHGYGERVGE